MAAETEPGSAWRGLCPLSVANGMNPDWCKPKKAHKMERSGLRCKWIMTIK
jgi:hypothetical protein